MLERETDVVSSIRLAIADLIGSNRYELWLADSSLTYDANILEIGSSKQFQLEWIRNNFAAEIQTACKDVMGCDVDLRFRLAEKPQAQEALQELRAKATVQQLTARPTPPNRRQTHRTNDPQIRLQQKRTQLVNVALPTSPRLLLAKAIVSE